jgi:murein DD-endopeptidase MepM/ murein hydrolase activator NlpD
MNLVAAKVAHPSDMDSPIQLAMLRTEIGSRPTLTSKPTSDALPSPSPSPVGIGGLGYFIPELETPTPEVNKTLTRTEIITYVVQAGDMVGTISRDFGISEDTLCWANGRLADNPDYLRVGQHLYILPIDGVLHIVEKGDTLSEIAETYKAEVQDIVDYAPNGLTDASLLVEGQELIVPDGEKPYTPRWVSAWSGTVPTNAKKGSGSFVWPTSGVVTQKYWSKHPALDVGWSEGTSVIAADSGAVILTGYSASGYGRYVVIDHGNGFRTLYAHLQMFFVKEGESVAKGQKIGLMGNTGRSTGPHLHFEIRKNGVKRNPLIYLP